MKNTQRKSTSMKKTLLTMLATVICVSACAVGTDHHVVNLSPEDQMLKNKFRGIYGVVLRLDAATPKEYITMTSQTGRLISGAGYLSLNNVSNQTYTDSSMPIPKTVHAIWRTGVTADAGQGKWLGGTVVGDYTVPVAERIPDSILDYIRKNGGALRLKIRLKDDGILIGWDVEKSLPIPGCKKGEVAICTAINYLLPGGDFRERRPSYGGAPDPGWQN
jgi:hypothetical protein